MINIYILICYISDEAHNETAKQSIRTKCATYLERAEKLKEYVNSSKATTKNRKYLHSQ